jgi:hypothetical protein
MRGTLAPLKAQGGFCICRRPEIYKDARGRTYRLNLYAQQATSTVRALLCRRCQVAIMLMGEEIGPWASMLSLLSAAHRVEDSSEMATAYGVLEEEEHENDA